MIHQKHDVEDLMGSLGISTILIGLLLLFYVTSKITRDMAMGRFWINSSLNFVNI